MSGYITAKQRWVADRQFKAGQPLKYRRTIGGLSKDYVLVAKYTDAIPEMWPAWFENVHPNTWFLPSNLIAETQIWPGDTIVDFGTGQKYHNNSADVRYAGEIDKPEVFGIPSWALVVRPFDEDKKITISPAYNEEYDEMKYTGFWGKSNAWAYNWYLYNVEGSTTFYISVTDTYPLIFSSSINVHSITINYLDYTSISFTGVAPNSTTGTSCTYLFANAIADYELIISNVGGNITIHRNA